MALKSKLRLNPDSDSPARNSFTATDYYRDTRDEYFSPISKLASLSPDSPYADHMTSPTRLMYIPEDYSDKGGMGEGAQQRVGNRAAAAFWHIFHALFCKWRCQKAKSKTAQR